MLSWLKRKPTFEEVALRVLELKRGKRSRTYGSAKWQIARLIKHFKAIPLANIGEASWMNYVLVETKRKKRNFFDDRKHMKTILLYSFREGFIKRVPHLEIFDLPSDVGREISQEEKTGLLAHANSRLAFQIEIAWRMGLRLREMLGLQWSWFDWKRETILLPAQSVKTRRRREVPFDGELKQKFLIEKRIRSGPFVFPSRFNFWVPQTTNKTAWRRAKRLSGVFCRWHDLRHTCATILLRKGIKTHVVGLYLGMSEGVLQRIYAHLSLDDLKDASRAMSGP